MSLLSLYSGATGMENEQTNLNVISNNIANVNTNGFKKSKVEFKDLLYQNQKPVGADAGTGAEVPVGVEVGNGSQVAATSKVFTQGQLTKTDEDFDLAIEGAGFLEVQLADGSTGYTRDGALKVNSQGQITTSSGNIVGSGFQAVPSDLIGMHITNSGQVTYQSPGGDTVFRIQLARFGNPSGLKSLGNNLYAATDASGIAELGNPAENGFGSIHHKFLEKSNVSVVQEMVNMIVAQRAYELNSKSIKTSDEMLAQVSQIKR